MTTASSVLDLYRAHKGRVDVVDVPEILIAAVDGRGDPDGPEFAAAIQALYGASYPAHFLAMKRLGEAPRVMPLEALWWVEDDAATDTFTQVATGEASVDDVDRSLWRWRAFIVRPSRARAQRPMAAQATSAIRRTHGGAARGP